MNTTDTQVKTTEQKEYKVEFTGRYAPVQKEFYSDMVRVLGFSSEQAERTARDLGSDLGRIDKIDSDNFKLRLGKLSTKDMTIRSVNMAIGVKNVPSSYSLRIFKIVAELNTISQWGLELPDCKFELNKSTMDQVNKTAWSAILLLWHEHTRPNDED